ncbi:serine phosphatase RsbU (regulator of sigma subunit) [Streptomyces sp. Amel2xB2]|uniref:PP2C family protein-serine/threonine phosphatase n=1 Tax=Streptomyces sp. Amel2xB2 TaxID=1305829 RepID=UPI000DB99431|nr:PP2C family protein-serine/threonine phosphatase [Streptomyces sp. Amel2xB2]RAJ67132.1 serine phosphatase RsbU (regulator of sigma subunit) [Streptomyces sp. Amel2xB2]
MDRLTAVERALRAAAPYGLLDVVADALRQHYSAVDVQLRMADYGVRSLQAVGADAGIAGEAVDAGAAGEALAAAPAAEPVLIHDSPQGRAFGAADPVVVPDLASGTVTVHIAVSVRGDRVGVLSVTLPESACEGELLPELTYLSEALGHEIMVAERDTDLYLLARRASRLTLAAEMQWQLLPGRSCRRPEFALGAHLEPAYAIFGDNFDWSSSADHLTLTVTNGMGEGIDAALLSNLAVNAVRNARRAGLGLADQAFLADQAVFAQYRGAAYVSMLLMRFALETGRVEVVEAGSPRVWRMREGKVEPLGFDAQLPLGMFEDTGFVAEYADVRPGDRLLIASDGVYDTSSKAGERYGEAALVRSLAANRLLPAAQVPRAILRELSEYRGVTPLDDDALVLCLDWYGREDGAGGAATRDGLP